MESEKLVSVIIPTCNRDLCYVLKAIKSIKQQTYKNYEIILVDDNICNSIYSLNIKKYCKEHNIKYLKTKGRQGANAARNMGAHFANGNYLAFLDDDDICLPNKLEVQLKCFSNNIGMVYSNGYVFTQNSTSLYTNPKNFISKGNFYKLLLYNYIGPTITALIKKECFFDVGMFDENMPSKQDYDLWIRISEKYKIVGINQPLFIYMRHDSYQISKDYNLILEGYKKLYKKYKKYFINDNILNSFFYLKIAKIYKYKKRYFKYIKYIFLAFLNIRNENLNILF